MKSADLHTELFPRSNESYLVFHTDGPKFDSRGICMMAESDHGNAMVTHIFICCWLGAFQLSIGSHYDDDLISHNLFQLPFIYMSMMSVSVVVLSLCIFSG